LGKDDGRSGGKKAARRWGAILSRGFYMKIAVFFKKSEKVPRKGLQSEKRCLLSFF
jgi:hypothetical protein